MTDNSKSRKLIEKTYRESYVKLLYFALRKIGSRERAEELVQDAFIIAMQRQQEIPSERLLLAWLYKTLRNLILHEYRDRENLVKSAVHFEDLSEADEPSRLDQYNNDSLSGIDIESRELLYNIYIRGYSIQEMAKELGITSEACRKRLERARKKARDSLGDEI